MFFPPKVVRDLQRCQLLTLSKQLGWDGGQLVVRQVSVVGIHNVKGVRFIIPDESSLIGHKNGGTRKHARKTSRAIFIYL